MSKRNSRIVQYTDKWYVLICKEPRCQKEFHSLSSQKLYCDSCTVLRVSENKKRQKAGNKSAKKDLPLNEAVVKRVLITDAEQHEINKAIALKNHAPPDLGRRLEGEEFARIAALYEKKG